MSVDFRKTRKILFLHGVQTGQDQDIKAHESIKELIDKCLQERGLPHKFDLDMFTYENINDESMG